MKIDRLVSASLSATLKKYLSYMMKELMSTA